MVDTHTGRRALTTAVVSSGALIGLGLASVAGLFAQAQRARHWIGRTTDADRPDIPTEFGAGPGKPLRVVLLGDSTAVGLGAHHASATPGAVIASGVAALSGRRVYLSVPATVGARTSDLARQLDRLQREGFPADVAIIIVGANDITARVPISTAVESLAGAVRRLRGNGTPVVVGTCPDLGTVEPIAQPLRALARRWSRRLAAAQTVAVIGAGGRTVSLADVLGPEFAARPHELFSADRFHPSDAGYARAAAALLPSVCAVLGLLPDPRASAPTTTTPGGGTIEGVSRAATKAATHAGTEVSPTPAHGYSYGPWGRWATMIRRPTLTINHRVSTDANTAGNSGETSETS